MQLDDVRAIQYGDVLVEGERWPNSIHVIEHPDGRVLVDTGMIESTPDLDAEWGVLFDAAKIPRDAVCVINTHLHFEHCGGNRLYAGTPIHVQRAEREAARAPDYTIPEWVEFDGAEYVEHVGEAEIVPGVRVLPTPGHTPPPHPTPDATKPDKTPAPHSTPPPKPDKTTAPHPTPGHP